MDLHSLLNKMRSAHHTSERMIQTHTPSSSDRASKASLVHQGKTLLSTATRNHNLHHHTIVVTNSIHVCMKMPLHQFNSLPCSAFLEGISLLLFNKTLIQLKVVSEGIESTTTKTTTLVTTPCFRNNLQREHTVLQNQNFL